jgi:acyl-CoA thioesterase-1
MAKEGGATLVTKQSRIRRTAGCLALATLFAVGAPAVVARAQAHPACDAPLSLLRLANPLAHFARKLSTTQPITIVAVGSSSTEGAGASSKAANYPSRLEAELRERFPGHPITVLNRGIGGQVIGDMLKRFDAAVVAAKPDLVLWQLGTNSVLRQHQPVTDDGAAISAGLAKIRATGADVVLIDPQYAPKVINKHDVEPMLALISLTAKQANVDLFRRFAVMKRWHDRDHLKFEVFVSRDRLHMNDWSYACMAKGLSAAIAEAATRPVMSAASRPIFEGPH